MNQVQVDVFQPQPVERTADGVSGFGLIAVPQLGRDVQIISGNPALTNCLPHTLFVLIDARRIDVAMGTIQKLLDEHDR